MGEKITRVLVPTEKVVEVRNKQKRETEQKFFPGYVLVEMELTDDTWHLVRSTPKVTGFVGSGAKPVALPAGDYRVRYSGAGQVSDTGLLHVLRGREQTFELALRERWQGGTRYS